MTADSEKNLASIGLAAVNLQGFIDAVERNVVFGWAWNPQRPDDTVEVEIMLGGQRLGIVAADKFRSDLVDLEIGDGKHAFEFALPDHLVGQVDGAEIEVLFSGSEIPLPRMEVIPQRRHRQDGPQRTQEELVLALKERIAMQERVIKDMSNLLRVLVDKVRDMSAFLPKDQASAPVLQTDLQEALDKQASTMRSLETYMATFGQSLREIAEAQGSDRQRASDKPTRFRAIEVFLLLLIGGVVVSFVIVFGDFF